MNVGSKLGKLNEKYVSFTSNTKVMQSSGCTVVLNISESPDLDKCTDQIWEQLKYIHACIFVFEKYSKESFDAFEKFTKANRKSLKNVEWVLWENSQEQLSNVDANIKKLASKYSFAYYNLWFYDKAQVETFFAETVDRYV